MSENFDPGKLADDLHELASDAEALLKPSANANGAQAQYERLAETLRGLRARLAGLEEQVSARARELDGYVHENPWQSMAIAGCAGLILGLMLSRR